MTSDDDIDGGETFDEEAEERDQGEIEQLLDEFVDEPSIRHDQVPESDDEEEKGYKKKPAEVTHIRRGDGRLYKKQTFLNGVGFKDCVLDYALRTGRNIQQYRYDKDKIGFKCMGSNDEGTCGWKIYASVLPSDNIWKVRVFVENHSCVPNGQCSMLRVPQIEKKKMTKAEKKRKKPANESPTKKQPKNKKRIMHCGICGQPDHNSRFHSKKQATGGGPSQVASPAASQAPSPATSQASSQVGGLGWGVV